MLQPGHSIAGHRVGTQLGGGPLAATYTIVSQTGTPVGVLRLLLVRLGEFRNRFHAAAEVLRGVHHPNLVQIFDVVEVDGRIGVITEFVPGGNLTDWIKRSDRSPAQVVPMFCRIARGVAAAHDAGLLHRNLKPSKVLVSEPGQPRIAGFALGKITLPDAESNTEVGTTFGTPQYMPPEQFRGVAEVDERADLFALGCILYEMLTGTRAFEGTDLLEMYRNVLSSDIDPLPHGVPAGLVGLVADLLDPERDRRPPTVQAIFDRLIEDEELRPYVETALPGADPLQPGVQVEDDELEEPTLQGDPPMLHGEPPPIPADIQTSTVPRHQTAPATLVPPVAPAARGAARPRQPVEAARPMPMTKPPAQAPAAPPRPAARPKPPSVPAKPLVPPARAMPASASVHPRRRGGAPSLPPPRNRASMISLANDPADRSSVRSVDPHPFEPMRPEPFPQWARVAIVVSTLALLAAIATVVLAVAVTM